MNSNEYDRISMIEMIDMLGAHGFAHWMKTVATDKGLSKAAAKYLRTMYLDVDMTGIKVYPLKKRT